MSVVPLPFAGSVPHVALLNESWGINNMYCLLLVRKCRFTGTNRQKHLGTCQEWLVLNTRTSSMTWFSEGARLVEVAMAAGWIKGRRLACGSRLLEAKLNRTRSKELGDLPV